MLYLQKTFQVMTVSVKANGIYWRNRKHRTVIIVIMCWGSVNINSFIFVPRNSKFKQTNHRKGHANQSHYVPPLLKSRPIPVEVGGAFRTTAQDSNLTWLRGRMLMKAHKIEGKSNCYRHYVFVGFSFRIETMFTSDWVELKLFRVVVFLHSMSQN